MEASKASETADLTAMVRAHEHMFTANPVFADDLAFALTSQRWQRILSNRFRKWLVVDLILRPFRGGAAITLSRARFVEDLLDAAIEKGCAQYVLVGAGMDSFAFRRTDLAGRMRVIELDHPATQAVKRERLEALGRPAPPNLEYVPVDFEQERIDQALARSSYDANQSAVFCWMGVTYYLEPDTVYGALESMARCSASGSEIVFDYQIRRDQIAGKEGRVMRRLDWLTQLVGEPVLGEFDPAELSRRLPDIGLELAENLTPEQLTATYLGNHPDGLVVPPGMRLARVRVT